MAAPTGFDLAGRFQLDFSSQLVDAHHPHGDAIAQTEGAAGAPADERAAGVAEHVEVPAERAGGNIAFIALLKTHEQSRRNDADDLAFEDLVPAFFVKQPVKQEGENNVVAGALRQGRAAFVLGACLRDFGKLQPAATEILEMEFIQERAVDYQVRVAPDRRGEVQVGLRGQAEMPEIVLVDSVPVSKT